MKCHMLLCCYNTILLWFYVCDIIFIIFTLIKSYYKIYISNKCCPFELSNHQKGLILNSSLCIIVSIKILSSTTVFSFDKNKKYFLGTKCFLKDHLILKTEVLMLKIHFRRKVTYSTFNVILSVYFYRPWCERALIMTSKLINRKLSLAQTSYGLRMWLFFIY